MSQFIKVFLSFLGFSNIMRGIQILRLFPNAAVSFLQYDTV